MQQFFQDENLKFSKDRFRFLLSLVMMTKTIEMLLDSTFQAHETSLLRVSAAISHLKGAKLLSHFYYL